MESAKVGERLWMGQGFTDGQVGPSSQGQTEEDLDREKSTEVQSKVLVSGSRPSLPSLAS